METTSILQSFGARNVPPQLKTLTATTKLTIIYYRILHHSHIFASPHSPPQAKPIRTASKRVS
jgi:hypothetical protein